MIRPADRTLFVGSYASQDEPGIHWYAVDETGNELRPKGTLTGVRNPSFLALHPDGGHLYAVSETGLRSDGAHGAVHAFRIDRDHGALDLVALGHRSTAGDHPCHLSIDTTGRWLAVANYGTGDFAVFPILTDGSLGGMASSAKHSGSGPDPDRQRSPHVHSTTFTPDNRFLIVADLGIDRLVIYTFDADAGSIRRHGDMPLGPGAGPRHLLFHPDAQHLFVVNELESSITLCRYDERAGSLDPLQTLSTLPPQASENTAADLHVSPAGTFVYVSNRGHDSLAVYAFDPVGALEWIGVYPSGGNGPRGFGLTPDGHQVVVANRRSNEISLVPLLSGGSDIGEPVARVEVPQPSCIVFA